MNHQKRERINKLLIKLKLKKDSLNNSIFCINKNILDYIITNQIYRSNTNIINLFSTLPVNILDSLSEVNSQYGDDRGNNICESDYNILLTLITKIDESDFKNEDIVALEDIIKHNNNKIQYLDIKKNKSLSEIKEVKQEYRDVPDTLINNLLREKQNIYDVIERIQILQERNNCNFIDQLLSIEETIEATKIHVNQLKNILNQKTHNIKNMAISNIHSRKVTVKNINDHKILVKTQNKKLSELNNYKRKVESQYTTVVNNINSLKEQEKTLRIENRCLNDLTKIEENKEILSRLHNEIVLDQKKMKMLINEKTRYSKLIELELENQKQVYNTPKAISKTDFNIYKQEIASLRVKIQKNNDTLLNLKNSKINLATENIEYNYKLDTEFNNSKQRLIIVSQRIWNEYENNLTELNNRINNINQELLNYEQDKIKLINTNDSLKKQINTYFKDNINILEMLKTRQEYFKSLNSVEKDINSYQKIVL